MQANTLVGIVAIAFCAYGAISLLLDLRRGILWVVRGLWAAVIRIVNTMAYYWRSWVADRERRRRQDRDQLQALQTTTIATLTSLVEEMQRKCALLEATRDEALAKPPAPAQRGN